MRQSTILLIFPLLLTLSLALIQIPQVHSSTDQTVEGVVVGGAGPISNLTITLRKGGAAAAVAYTTLTNSTGGYSILNLDSSAAWTVELSYNGTKALKSTTTGSAAGGKSIVNFYLLGSITGMVSLLNGTTIPGVKVLVNDTSSNILANVTADSQGRYYLRDLDLNGTYNIWVEYMSLGYSWVNQVFLATRDLNLNFTVYAFTTSDQVISVATHHILVTPGAGALEVNEVISYTNIGDMVFNNSRIKIWLPNGYTQFTSSVMECCVYPAEDGVLIDPMTPIPPNEAYEVDLKYKLSYDASDYFFSRKLDYLTSQLFFIVLNGEKVGQVSGSQGVGGAQFFQDPEFGNYWLASGENLGKESFVTVKLSGLSIPSPLEGILVWVLPLGAVGALIASYPFLSKRFGGKGSVKGLEAQKQQLFAKMSDLEAERAAGRVSEEKYNRLMERYKARGVSLVQRIEKTRSVPPKTKAARKEEELPTARVERAEATSTDELEAEKSALVSTLDKLDADFKESRISRETYLKVGSKYQSRLREVREALGGAEEQ